MRAGIASIFNTYRIERDLADALDDAVREAFARAARALGRTDPPLLTRNDPYLGTRSGTGRQSYSDFKFFIISFASR